MELSYHQDIRERFPDLRVSLLIVKDLKIEQESSELEKFNPELLDKKRILMISKSDMLDDELKAEIEETLPKVPYIFISSVAQQGLSDLKDMIWENLDRANSKEDEIILPNLS